MNAPLLARNGALTIAFALCCLFGRTVAGDDSYLFATGPRIFAYNISTLILAICYVLSAFSLGSLFIGSARFRVADRFVIGAATGFAVLNIVGQGVGMVGLLNQTVSTALICAPLLFLPPVSRKAWSFLQENKGYILFFSAISLYIFCFSALIRNENSGDFVFYLPTYEKIVQSGSTLPNLSFLGYCYVKGFGAAHLLMAATSQYSVQYLSAACILLTCFLGARICDLLIPNKALSACFALLLLASGFMRAETYKTHALTSLLLLAAVFLMVQRQLAPKPSRPAALRASLLCLAGLLTLSPQAGAFLALPFLADMISAWRTRRPRAFGQAFVVAGAAAAVFFAVLVSNYLLFGVPELSLPSTIKGLIDLDRVDRWYPRQAMELLLVSFSQQPSSGALDLSLGSLAFPALKILVLTAATPLFRYALRDRPGLRNRYTMALPPFLALGAACILLKAVTQYSSIDRYTLFGIIINRLVIATALYVGGAALYRFASTRIRIPVPFGKLVFAAFAVLSLHAAISNKLPDTPRQITYTRHFLGLAPFAETFWWLRDPAAEKVLTLLPRGTRVMPLYPALYATILPRVIFELSDTTDTAREADTLYLSPDPAEAARTYIRLGLRHFMIDLDGMIMPYPGYGALFRPEYLADHFRARHLTGKRWLLTLEGTDADGIRPDRNFMADYARGYALALTNPRNSHLNTLKAWARNRGVDFQPSATGWPPMSRNDSSQEGDQQ
jgi:hypothetical protein